MRVAHAIAEILKREGVEILFAYPVNPLIEAGAGDRHPRRSSSARSAPASTWRTPISRLSSGDKVGVFCCRTAPAPRTPSAASPRPTPSPCRMVVHPRRLRRAHRRTTSTPTSTPPLNYQHITKWAEQLTVPQRPARTPCAAPSPRPATAAPALPASRSPATSTREEVDAVRLRARRNASASAPTRRDVDEAAEVLVDAERPIIYAGQGVHYAKAWAELKELAELLEAPGHHQPGGQELLPGETTRCPSAPAAAPCPQHGLAAHHGRRRRLRHRLQLQPHRLRHPASRRSDKTYIHNTLDPADINKDIPAQHAARRRRQAHPRRP